MKLAARLTCLSILRVARERRGAAAVEFAVVGSVFLLLLLLALEFGLILFTQAALDNATAEASRLIMTGQSGGASQTAFTAAVCSQLGGLVPCSAIQVDVQSATSFASLTPSGTGASGLANTGYAPGGAGADVLVQVAYPRPFVIPWIGEALGLGSTFTLLSTAAFQSEPY